MTLRSAFGQERWWLLTNALLICAYLFIARSTWGEYEELDLAISRAITEGPIFIVGGILDLIWLTMVVKNAVKRPFEWKPLLIVLLTFGVWIGAYALDRSQWGPPAA